jgi:hypothetical protein
MMNPQSTIEEIGGCSTEVLTQHAVRVTGEDYEIDRSDYPKP